MAKLTDDADYDAGKKFENVSSLLSDAGNHDNYYGRRLRTRCVLHSHPDNKTKLRQRGQPISKLLGYVTEADLRRDLPHEDAEYCIARMKLFTGGKGDIGALDYELFAQEIFNE
ncbi:unnamed protein product [Protopolystoma xenopodis]|uniref:EF-hand Ca insensitive domain-containing protein n=1 Tax=Protopolystoma xenopodis TaxID=117903 RepID=A0A3S4ZZX4_9PLAT|nr:unnamed protein product [Protopolystoma xenopodis]